MRHYVKIENGVIVDGPKEIPSLESSSPNVHWGTRQMNLHGFYEVKYAPFNPDTHKIDLNNPQINDYYVFYDVIPLSSSELNSVATKNRLKEYPLDHDILWAIYLSMTGDQKPFDEIKSKIDSVNSKYPNG